MSSFVNDSKTSGPVAAIWKILEEVCDPEVPVLTILDLGVVRNVILHHDENGDSVEVVITPTYTGCPAMDMIAMQTRMTLAAHGYPNVKITTVLAPAWTTEWMSDAGKEKLEAYGIAAPYHNQAGEVPVVACPQCHSTNTTLISRFGSTACKALYRCEDCREPFDYFKCH